MRNLERTGALHELKKELLSLRIPELPGDAGLEGSANSVELSKS